MYGAGREMTLLLATHLSSFLQKRILMSQCIESTWHPFHHPIPMEYCITTCCISEASLTSTCQLAATVYSWTPYLVQAWLSCSSLCVSNLCVLALVCMVPNCFQATMTHMGTC